LASFSVQFFAEVNKKSSNCHQDQKHIKIITMEFISEDLSQYCETHTSPESKVLSDLNRETHLKVLSPRMLSGHLQGSFLTMISHMIRPMHILEIGTYTGYSAICLAQGFREGGQLISIDVNEETSGFAQKHIDQSNVKEKIRLVLADAKSYIPTLTQSFEIVFIDADKKNYEAYYELVFDKVAPGGFILIDNVLWSGKVTVPEQDMDRETLAIHRLNQKVQDDPRVENVLLPLRDGIMVVRKK
jgi:predicted O-methyltransferase YrrM